ncbi:MAG: V-type ATP synthase subunit F [Acutalibacteraceae bacterium]|nr:V-type ATP synthase subunit F [Acutalibacteraceae bacterium]
MVKIAVLGDTESIKGFAAVGLDIYHCDKDGEAEQMFLKIVTAGYGIIYVTERLVPILKRQIEKTDKMLTPSVVPIIGVSGNNGAGTAALKAAVEKAVGSDIIFNK